MRRGRWLVVVVLAAGACGSGSEPATTGGTSDDRLDPAVSLAPAVVDPSGPAAAPEVQWSADVGDGVLVGDVVVAQTLPDPRVDTVSVAAFDVRTGERRWTRDEANLAVAPLAGPREPLARTAPGTLPFLVVGSPASGEVHGLDPETGEVGWTVDLDADVSVPLLVTDDLVVVAAETFFGDDDASSDVAAIDPATGEVRWTASEPTAMPEDGCLTDTAVVTSDSDGGVIAYDRATGATLADVSGVEPLGCVPGGVVVGRDSGAELLGPTGAASWRVAPGSIPTAAVAAGDLVVLLGADAVVAVDATDGAEAWRRPRDPAADVTLLVAGGVVVVGGALVAPGSVNAYDPPSELVALDPATGAVRWGAPAGRSGATVLVADAELLYLAADGELLAIGLATGSEEWSVAAGDTPAAPSSLGGGRLLVNGDAELAVWGVG